MPSPRVSEDAEAALRRLRADVQAFRSREVRSLLDMQMDMNMGMEAAEEASVRTIPALEAQLILFRTQRNADSDRIQELEAEVSTMKKLLQTERKRTADFRISLGTTEQERDTYRTRVGELERDHLSATKTASENAALLSLASKSVSGQVAALQDNLRTKNAELEAANLENHRIRAVLEAKERSWKYQEEQFTNQVADLSERLDAADDILARARAQGNESVAEATERMLNATKRSENSAREIAALRAECAARTDETSNLLVQSADCAEKARLIGEKLRMKEAELEGLETMKNRFVQVQKELIRAQNSLELMAPVRAEKETLARLIGALAPSGNAADGLVLLRQAALKKCLPKQYTSCGDSIGVSKKAVEDIRKRLEELSKGVDKDVDALPKSLERDLCTMLNAELQQTKRERDELLKKVGSQKGRRNTNVRDGRVSKSSKGKRK